MIRRARLFYVYSTFNAVVVKSTFDVTADAQIHKLCKSLFFFKQKRPRSREIGNFLETHILPKKLRVVFRSRVVLHFRSLQVGMPVAYKKM